MHGYEPPLDKLTEAMENLIKVIRSGKPTARAVKEAEEALRYFREHVPPTMS